MPKRDGDDFAGGFGVAAEDFSQIRLKLIPVGELQRVGNGSGLLRGMNPVQFPVVSHSNGTFGFGDIFSC